MAIQLATTRQTLCNQYVAAASWIGTATGSPGTSATPANESTGGGYARKQTTWTPSSGGVNTGSAVTIDVAASTITHVILATAATVASANMWDWSDTSDIVFSATGQAVVSPTMTIT